MFKKFLTTFAFVGLLFSSSAFSATVVSNDNIIIEPYFRLNSNKNIKFDKLETGDFERAKQRMTYGLNITAKIKSIYRAEMEFGVSSYSYSERVRDVTDEFGKVNFIEDLNMSTNNPDQSVTIKDKQYHARLGLVLAPNLDVFILRAKVGVEGVKREVFLTQNDVERSHTPEWMYNPYASFSVGVKPSTGTSFSVSYGFRFYDFPDMSKFHREVSVSGGLSI